MLEIEEFLACRSVARTAQRSGVEIPNGIRVAAVCGVTANVILAASAEKQRLVGRDSDMNLGGARGEFQRLWPVPCQVLDTYLDAFRSVIHVSPARRILRRGARYNIGLRSNRAEINLVAALRVGPTARAARARNGRCIASIGNRARAIYKLRTDVLRKMLGRISLVEIDNVRAGQCAARRSRGVVSDPIVHRTA